MSVDFDRIRNSLQFIPASDRNVWVRIGMAIKSEFGDAGFDLWEAWSQQDDSFDPRAARDVWKSIRANGKVTAATIIYEAKAHGWRDEGGYQTPTAEEREARRLEVAERIAKEEVETTRQRGETASRAAAILKAATEAKVDHPYLSRKRVSPVATLREIDAGAAAAILGYAPKSGGELLAGRLLVVPVKQGDRISTLELIDGDKRKAALAGRGSKVGGYWATERLPDGDGTVLTLLIGEGVATVLSASAATGHPGIAALSSSNLPAVAKAMRERYPSAVLVFLADLVKATGEPDPHAIDAAQLVGGKLAIPGFGVDRDPGMTDFNDMALICGLEAVAQSIRNANVPHGADGPEPFIRDIPPTPWPANCMPPGMTRAADAIAEHVQAPKALAGMAVLGAVAHIAMRLVDARHPKKGALPASLYILTALESGGRKSECFSMATAPIAKQERAAREAHKAKLKQLEAETARAKPKDRASIMLEAPSDPRTIFVDTTTQKVEFEYVNGSAPALSLSTDEGGTLLGGHSLKAETRAASLGALTRLFDGTGVQRDRVGEGQSGFRYGVRFGLFLSAQPIVLADALSDPLMRGQGFLPRFLYASPASLAGTRFHDENTLSRLTADDQRLASYWKTLERMCSITVKVDEHGGLILTTAKLDSEAIAVWLAFYNKTERQQGEGGAFESLGAFASRSGELVVRAAAVYAAWRCCEGDMDVSSVIVTVEDMQCAVALVGFSLAEWHRHAAGTALSPIERDARDLLEWLHRKDWKTATRVEIGQLCPNALRKDARRRNAAIDELRRRRWLIDSAGVFNVMRNKATPHAVAVSAVSAVGQRMETAETAKKATAIAGLTVLPEPSRRTPVTEIDVSGNVAALLGSQIETGTVEVEI